MGFLPKDGKPIKLTGEFLHVVLDFTICGCIRRGGQSWCAIPQWPRRHDFLFTQEDLRHLQPEIPVHCDNATAIRIANNTIKRQCSRAMEMRYFWVGIKVSQDMHSLSWHPGKIIMAITKVSTIWEHIIQW
jgi:hypothetical protein